MNILGLSAYYHDAAAVLLQDGKISCALQEERFSRIKHDAAFPRHALQHLFAICPPPELDYIAYYEKPLRKFERIIDTFLSTAPRGIKPFRKSIPSWSSQKLFLPRTLKREFKKAARLSGHPIQRSDRSSIPPLVFPSHHESHAASAFFPSPFNDAAILTIDGVGEWSTMTYGTGSGHQLDLHAQQSFPHSLGLLYSAFTTYCGFRVNSGEYKLMGLAPYGTPKYTSKILDHLITLHPDGSFHLDLSYFGYLDSMQMVNEKFESLFGQPTRNRKEPDGKPDSEPLTTFHMDIAASIQEVTENVMLTLARHIHAETGQKNLCLAGGVALNCVANGRLHREGPFEHIWVQPAAGDAGGALGAALFTEHQLLEKPRQHLTGATGQKTPSTLGKDAMQFSLLGTSSSERQMLKAINSFHPDGPIPHSKPADQKQLHSQVAKLINDEKVVARFDGRMEFGPRALGNRSILGDPRSPRLQSVMNRKIKFREDFRPFAPLCLAEHAAEYFSEPHHSPYMLTVAQLLEQHHLHAETDSGTGFAQLQQTRSTLPAITHVNHSARLQTLTAEVNPGLHDLLSTFHQLTGCPMLINTSFNVRGEPIVESPEDALRCFLATDIDALILGPYLLSKENIPESFLIPRKQHLEKFNLD